MITAHHVGSYRADVSDTDPTAGGWQEAGEYEIRLSGRLDQRWATRFDGLTLVREDDGTTVLRGSFVDQSALHGLLQQVRDLAVPLISVARVAPTPPDAPPSPTDPDTKWSRP